MEIFPYLSSFFKFKWEPGFDDPFKVVDRSMQQVVPVSDVCTLIAQRICDTNPITFWTHDFTQTYSMCSRFMGSLKSEGISFASGLMKVPGNTPKSVGKASGEMPLILLRMLISGVTLGMTVGADIIPALTLAAEL